MKEFNNLVEQAVLEIEDWVKTSKESSKYDQNWINKIKESIKSLKGINDINEFSSSYGLITYLIVDSGPLSGEFSPSFDLIGLALGKREKKKDNKSFNTDGAKDAPPG